MKTKKQLLSFILVLAMVVALLPAFGIQAVWADTKVAKIVETGQEYTSIASALEAATAGQTIKMIGDSAEGGGYR